MLLRTDVFRCHMKILFACLAVLFYLPLPGALAQGTPKKAPVKVEEKKAAEPTAEEQKAAALVKELAPATKTKLLGILNKGTAEELREFPGVGETKSAAIIKARPFASVDSVIRVKGVGLGLLEDLVKHAKAGFPKKEDAPKKAATPKKGGKEAAPKKAS